MHATSFQKLAGLAIVWCAAILLAVGSKSYDPDPAPVLPPVMVDFVVANGGLIEFSNGTTDDSVNMANLRGSFEKPANDRITLREVPVSFDVNTSWAASVLPADPDELLRGEFSAAVTDPLEFGFDRQPAIGQIRSDFAGTSTLVTFSATGASVTLQIGGGVAQTQGFQDFRNAYTDSNRDLNERMASKAYRTLENLWLVSRISETLHREIEQQLQMFESVGLQSSLELECDNPNGTPAPSHVMRWSNDVSDAGNAGNGDNFTVNWRNCLRNADGRYLEADMNIENYQLANDTAPRMMSYTAEALSLFFAARELPAGSFPDENQERVTGRFIVSANEQ
ncbi:MAG: hypothetical protein HKN70_08730 [Gammaproteobacteria bacterium]|nr:hypothetical protein [Gammaproteobacteria bacterium]